MFCDLTGYDENKIGTAPTPFIDESKDPFIVIQEAPEPLEKAGTPSQPTQGAKSLPAKAGVTGELSHIAHEVPDEDHVHRKVCQAGPLCGQLGR